MEKATPNTTSNKAETALVRLEAHLFYNRNDLAALTGC